MHCTKKYFVVDSSPVRRRRLKTKFIEYCYIHTYLLHRLLQGCFIVLANVCFKMAYVWAKANSLEEKKLPFLKLFL